MSAQVHLNVCVASRAVIACVSACFQMVSIELVRQSKCHTEAAVVYEGTDLGTSIRVPL